jgi:glycosyltransferase involved in cell wall biosynthesis
MSISPPTNPIVDVIVVVYNHAKFIRAALDGLIMQQTTFPWRALIADDCSTDGTQEIIKEYATKHPGIIIPFMSPRNIGIATTGGCYAWSVIRKHSTAKYLILLEGDDYWTSPDKLQRQVDYLDTHPDCSMCFHNVLEKREGQAQDSLPRFTQAMSDFYTLEDIAVQDFIPTLSVMFRRELVDNLPAWYWKMPVGDWPLWCLCAQHGKIGYLNEIMGVYRIHSGGLWSGWSVLKRAEVELIVGSTIRRELQLSVPLLDDRIHRTRRIAVGLTNEFSDFKRASFHAKRYLVSSFGFLFRECLFLVMLIIHGDSPRLWRFMKRIQAIGRKIKGI